MVLVPKADESGQFFVNFNTVYKFDAYFMAFVDELFDWLDAAQSYSTLDLTKGY